MAKELYNLGRVTGLSAYELSVKHQLAEYPDLPSMTEKEWLAATVTSGASMILKIPGGTSAGAHDFPLPLDCSLCSGNSLIAYPFGGTCEFNEAGWATKVTSYGPLLVNTEDEHPVTPGDNASVVPVATDVKDQVKLLVSQMKDFVKLADGIIYQPGTWTPSETVPHMDFKPDLSLGSIIRLYFVEPVTQDFYIIFTGLVNRAIIAGVSALDGSPINSSDPEDGDFIGPEVFPWGNKILFTIPTTMMHLYNAKVRNVSTDSDIFAYSADIEISGNEVSAIALEDTEGNKFKFTGAAGILASDLDSSESGLAYITWKALLHALASNKKIDVLGDRLRTFRSHLPDLHTETNMYVGKDATIKGNTSVEGTLDVEGDVTTHSNVTVDKTTTTQDATIQNSYITINGIRIYVSSTAPTGTIPDGSLGIGW